MPPVRVLVVDDDGVQRLLLCTWLKQYSGVEVVADASCGREALAEMETARPDLVVTDVQMPGIDGFGLSRQLKLMENAPKVVIVSGNDAPHYPHLARVSGAETFIPKDSLHEQLGRFLMTEFGLTPGA
jgi:DNA-binding NarL/FixJ family response regulator